MVPLGRRIWKVPTWLAMRADWLVAARRTGSQHPTGWLAMETGPASLAGLMTMARRRQARRLSLRPQSDPVTTAIRQASRGQAGRGLGRGGVPGRGSGSFRRRAGRSPG